ncbi:hypothetical protein [Burkholderia vietnamiensis]|jgi:hypothetical protein|uniref:hypothetical protein n=1 Tax=Burkholderia vietnamiensis TaxID=60552 RepID=UPI000B0B8096|nr:hypothetical protein [Burkholderia vietnamiensis]MBR7974514.1 hypothetical protein [Burkholderia vietnamiensis]MBR8087705.1 hypothetical protein [Burkholderia vietnamiensis]MCA8183562.1 hypothetical protein [Burkholderia vietnamiensis]MDN7820953.1 hypothetical protein [Burkholderia vietnamiensis]HDR8925020.1 hypothetical protein [Burkholderia vietnamiensis]
MTAEQQGDNEFVTFSSDAYNAGFSLKLYVALARPGYDKSELVTIHDCIKAALR